MGSERACRVSYTTKEGVAKAERLRDADVMGHVAMNIGLGWVFLREEEQEVIRKIERAIGEVKLDLPKIFGQEPMLHLAKQLQVEVRKILDCMAEKAALVKQQRSGSDGFDWMKRAHEKDAVWKLTGHEGWDYQSLPWTATHFEEYREIQEMVEGGFGTPGIRKAVLTPEGSLFFEDEGVDAGVTISWMLYRFLDLIFENERAMLRKCQWCEKYFLHETLRPKKFCSDPCRYDYHNKGKRRD